MGQMCCIIILLCNYTTIYFFSRIRKRIAHVLIQIGKNKLHNGMQDSTWTPSLKNLQQFLFPNKISLLKTSNALMVRQ